MAEELDLQIKIDALTADAQKAFESLSGAFDELKKAAKGSDAPLKKTQSNIDKVANSAKKLGDDLSRVGKEITTKFTLAFTAIGALAVREFGQAEDEAFKLNNALRAFGRDSVQARRQFAGLADELERYTRFSGGAVTSAAGLATQFTKSNFETERLVRASAELAAVTGADLDTAVKQLGQTLNGQTGLLARQFPELSAYSEAQLKAGDAVEYFLSRFGGTAQRSAQTFNGQLIQLKNNIDSLLEVIGATFAPFISELVDGLNGAVNALKALNPEIRNQVILFAALAAGIGPLLVGLGLIASTIGSAIAGFKAFLIAAKPLLAIFSVKGALILGILAIIPTIAGLVNIFLKLKDVGNSTGQALIQVWQLISGAFKSFVIGPIVDGLTGITGLVLKIPGLAATAVGQTLQGFREFGVKLSEELDASFKLAKETIDQQLAASGSSAADAFTFGLSTQFENLTDSFNSIGQKAGEDIGEGLAVGIKEPTFSVFQFLKDNAESIGMTISGNLADSFIDIANGSKTAQQAFADFARSTLNYLARMIIQQQIFNSLQGFFGGLGASGGGGTSGAGAGNAGAGANVPFAATGGLITNGKVKRFNSGGFVSGPGGPTSDSVPAWLSNGEFVLRASAVKQLGTRFLYGLNSMGSKGGVPAFANGGMVNSQPSAPKVMIENMGTEKKATSAEQDPVTGVITIVLEDFGRNGPISKGIQNTFNVRRGGYR